jgi:hypothetical protein
MKADIKILKSVLEDTDNNLIEEIAGILAFNTNLSYEDENELFNTIFNEFIRIKEL